MELASGPVPLTGCTSVLTVPCLLSLHLLPPLSPHTLRLAWRRNLAELQARLLQSRQHLLLSPLWEKPRQRLPFRNVPAFEFLALRMLVLTTPDLTSEKDKGTGAPVSSGDVVSALG